MGPCRERKREREREREECSCASDHMTSCLFHPRLKGRRPPRVALPVNGPALGCDPVCLWMATGLREGRKSAGSGEIFHSGLAFLIPPQQLCTSCAHPHLGVDQRGERQVIKQVCEVLPHVGIAVFPQALVVEAVHLCDLSALVVPSEDCDALPVAYLKGGRAQMFASMASGEHGTSVGA